MKLRSEECCGDKNVQGLWIPHFYSAPYNRSLVFVGAHIDFHIFIPGHRKGNTCGIDWPGDRCGIPHTL